MGTTIRRYRISCWRPWLLAATLFVFIAGVNVLLSTLAGNPMAVSGVLPVLGIAALALLVPISLFVRSSTWDVDRFGVGGRNNWHVYHRLKWDDIDSVEPWLIPGYRYLQINGGGRRWVFWLPLFLTDMSSFRSAVAHYAPPDNPLRRYLEMHRR